MKVKPPAVPTPEWTEAEKKRLRFRHGCEFLVNVRSDGAKLFGGFFAIVPRLQCHKKQCVVSGLRLAQQTEAQHRRVILDTRRLRQNFLTRLQYSEVRGSEAALGSCTLI